MEVPDSRWFLDRLSLEITATFPLATPNMSSTTQPVALSQKQEPFSGSWIAELLPWGHFEQERDRCLRSRLYLLLVLPSRYICSRRARLLLMVGIDSPYAKM